MFEDRRVSGGVGEGGGGGGGAIAVVAVVLLVAFSGSVLYRIWSCERSGPDLAVYKLKSHVSELRPGARHRVQLCRPCSKHRSLCPPFLSPSLSSGTSAPTPSPYNYKRGCTCTNCTSRILPLIYYSQG